MKTEPLFVENVVEICSQLVRRTSVNPPGDESETARYIARILEESEIDHELIYHTPERASLIATIKGSGEKPGLMFSGHIDTVPVGMEKWNYEPFSGEVGDGKLWGRGSTDMKGGVAAMLAATQIWKKAQKPLRGDLFLSLSAGEEVDFLGAKALSQRDEFKNLQLLVIGEPSANQLFIAEKGVLWVKIATHGKTAHGAMPQFGRNAVLMMVDLLKEIESMQVEYKEHPLLGGFTKSVNMISGGIKTNVVPDYCSVTLDMRTVPGQDHRLIIQQIQGIIDKLKGKNIGFEAEVLVVEQDAPPVTTPEDHEAVHRFSGVMEKATGFLPNPQGVHYTTDAAIYVPKYNMPMVICGPGEPTLAHQPNEYVTVEQLATAVEIYHRAIEEFLG